MVSWVARGWSGGATRNILLFWIGTAVNPGYWRFEVPVGNYTVSASPPGYLPAERSAQVVEGHDTWASFSLEHEFGGG